MMNKLMNNLVKKATAEIEDENFSQPKPQSKKASKSITFEYANNICQKLFDLRQSPKLQSRIRFKIQDLIDAENKEWKKVFTELKNKRQVESDGNFK